MAMKRRFLALVGWLLLVCPLLRAQTGFICQYWFDGNYAAHTDIAVDTDHWQTPIEASHLTIGLHTLYLHLQDTSGQWTSPRSYLFYRMADTLPNQPTATYQCWFDQDRSTLQQGLIGDGNLLIETATLASGLHTFNLQLGSGMAARLQSFLFYKVPVADSGNLNMTYSCWFDQDTSTMQSGNVGSGHLLIDATAISDGLHTFNLQLNSGTLTSLQSYLFYRMPVQDSGDLALVYHCWFDQDYGTLQQGNISDGHLLLETSTLSDGLHTLNIQLGNGNAARLSSHLFMKMSSQLSMTDSTPLWWHYSIDGTSYPPISVTRSGQLIHLDLDVSTISDGLHTLSHFLMTESGSTLGMFSSLFYKIPLGGNGVKRYDYWYNDDETTLQQVTLATAVDTLRLIQLLEVDTMPFRSTSFQFDPHGGSPMVYARNKINFRFWDCMSRFVSSSKDFIDERVSRTVLADTLERDTTKVIPVPNNNAIHWFKLYAGVGDSLSFLTDRRCTMQLFAPSGEEVFSASGQQVLTWQGCHAWEDGIYYLAVHDAEGSGNIAVSYQWIYRYAVLAWDVHRVGNGGISTITFEGNGFDSISNIQLIQTSIDTIESLAIHKASNTKCVVTFDFTDEVIGHYNAHFIFGNEAIPINNLLNVETATNMELNVVVQHSNSFLRGTSARYAVIITNMGNSTAYDVPVEIEIHSTDSFNTIAFVNITEPNGLRWGSMDIRSTVPDTTPEDVIRFIEDHIPPDKGLGQFIVIYDSVNQIERGYSQQLLTIPPFGQYNFNIEIGSSNAVSCMVSIPSEWVILNTHEVDSSSPAPTIRMAMAGSTQQNNTLSKTGVNNAFCCHKERWECTADVITSILGFAPIAGCPVDLSNYYFFYFTEMACSTNGSLGDKFHNFFEQQMYDPSVRKAVQDKGTNTLISCALGSVGRYLDNIKDLIKQRKILRIRRADAVEARNHANRVADLKASRIRDLRNQADAAFNEGRYGDYNSLNAQITALELERESKLQEAYSLTMEIQQIDILENAIEAQLGEKGEELHLIYEWLNKAKNAKDIIQQLLCISTWNDVSPACQDKTDSDGGQQSPYYPVDPNEITGYIAESGSHAVSVEQILLPYMIEFENDTAFATAHAHTVVVRDTLDSNVFDLSSFSAKAFTIDDEVTNVDGGQYFTRTVDMRPTIDALAQVQLDYRIDTSFAVATWTFTSLDPMTLLPAADSLGFLGIGKTGEVDFTINRKADLPDSALIDNRAWIVFDNEEPIATSTWRNTIDNTPPISQIDSIVYHGDTAIVSIYATDNLSGVWRYNVYALMDGDVLLPMAMNVPIDSTAVFTTPDEVVQFRSTAIDSAGNVEPLILTPLISTVYDTLTITACDNYTWGDSTYTVSGEYMQNKTAMIRNTPDTMSTLFLTVHNSTTATETITACDNYTWHDSTYTASTFNSQFSTFNSQGCDSVTTLHLIVNHSTANTETITACDNYTWHGNAYTASTNSPTYTTTNIAGCDSLTTLHLTVNYSTTATETDTACDSYTWHDSVYTASTLNSQFSTLNSVGCDSTVTLHLTINYSTTSTETITACDQYIWHDSTYTVSTSNAQFSALNSVGCDSTVTLHLTINHSSYDTVVDTGAGHYEWQGNTYTESGEYVYEGQTEAGCDSIVVLLLTITEVGISTVDSLGDISLYPNPTTGRVTITASEVAKVEVFDPSGRTVATFLDGGEIDISHLPTGVYTLRITLRNGTAVKRVVKQ